MRRDAARHVLTAALAAGAAVALLATSLAVASTTPGPHALSQQTTASSAEPTAPARFDGAAAMKHVTALAKIGVRRSGTVGELRGANYIAARLRAMGYDPQVRTFRLPNGTTSRNVIARASADSTRVIVLGAHMDTKKPSPGANDNASGCGALLEIARTVAVRGHYADIEFVFFGAEEMVDKNPDHHHYGSRRYVKSLSATQRGRVSAMISMDMIGTGSKFVTRTMGIGPKSLSNLLGRRAKSAGFALPYLRDPSKPGYSDHEPFERFGIPVAWLEWRNDPYYHTARDTAKRLSTAKVARAGQLVLDFVLAADETMLARLR
jgi:Zn-dependent M28 family amino/carboxypeptidase